MHAVRLRWARREACSRSCSSASRAAAAISSASAGSSSRPRRWVTAAISWPAATIGVVSRSGSVGGSGRPALGVDPPVAVVAAVEQLQRRVGERRREPLAETADRRRSAEVDDEAGQCRPCPSRPHPLPGHAGGDEGERHDLASHSRRSVGSLVRNPRSRLRTASAPNSADAPRPPGGARVRPGAAASAAHRASRTAANTANADVQAIVSTSPARPRSCHARVSLDDEQVVRGASGAALGLRVEDRGRGEAQHADAGHGGDDEQDGRRPSEPSLVGSAQRRGRQQGRPGRAQDEAGGERGARTWAVPRGQRPRDARRDQQRREAAAGPASGQEAGRR